MRILYLAIACVALVACKGPLDRQINGAQIMANEPSDVLVGRGALKVWAEMSKEDRAHAMAAFAREAPKLAASQPRLGIVVLDQSLPPNTAASIIPDPKHEGGRLVVFARESYNDAVLAMVTQTLGDAKAHDLVKQNDRLHVTTSATLTDKDRQPLFQLSQPDVELARTSGMLADLMAVATSVAPIEIPGLGKGTIYRFE